MASTSEHPYGGIYAATVCPMTSEAAIDERALREHVASLAAVPFGTTAVGPQQLLAAGAGAQHPLPSVMARVYCSETSARTASAVRGS